MATWRQDERGEITVFLVLIFFALFAFGGLVYDGGHALAAKRRAMSEAQAAARAGADQYDEDVYRTTGVVVVDCGKATGAADSYLQNHTAHFNGATSVTCPDTQTVKVTLQFSQPMSMLGTVNITNLTINGDGTARHAHGIVAEGQ
jgi:Flp pilus assembly protein TadG